MDKPFDREVLNNLEQVISGDFNQLQSNADLALRELVLRNMATRASGTPDGDASTPPSGFIGDAFKVRPTNPVSMNVVVTPGLGVIDDPANEPSTIGGIVGLNDTHETKPVSLTQSQQFTVPNNVSGLTRFDIIEVAYSTLLTDQSSRNIFNKISKLFAPGLVKKTFSWNLNGRTGVGVVGGVPNQPIWYKQGTPGAGTPATDAGYVRIAVLSIVNGAVSVDYDAVNDTRRQIFSGGYGQISGRLKGSTVIGGNNILSIDRVMAPPGIKVAAIGTADGDADFIAGVSGYILLFSGSAILDFNIATMPMSNAGAATTEDSFETDYDSNGTLTAGEQNYLSGAIVGGGVPGVVTLTPMKAAQGQNRYKAGIVLGNHPSTPGPVTYTRFIANFLM